MNIGDTDADTLVETMVMLAARRHPGHDWGNDCGPLTPISAAVVADMDADQLRERWLELGLPDTGGCTTKPGDDPMRLAVRIGLEAAALDRLAG